MLLSDPQARAERAQAKRTAVLRFLTDEVWTSSVILGRVAGVGARQAVHRLLTTMEREATIRRASAPVLAGQGVTLWGITPHGLALAPEANPIGAYFEPSKLALERVPHHLGLQALRLQAEGVGWIEWMRGERLGKDVSIRPDALVRRPDGHMVAIEYERTIKTPKRYQRIVAEHLRAMRAAQWAGVYYICPDAVGAGLARLFERIDKLPGGIPWDDSGRRRFRVLAENAFPPTTFTILPNNGSEGPL